MIEGRPDNCRIKCVGNAFDFRMITDMKSDPKMPFVRDVDDLSSEHGQKIERRYWVRNEGDA